MLTFQDIVNFRRDLLFDGAVQLGWLESNRALAEKAASHFAFHGPGYRGESEERSHSDGHRLVDTASFTLDVIERLAGERPGEPFELAVAGYGTGKSHLAVTLACLLSDPRSPLGGQILSNLSDADPSIGKSARAIIERLGRPFLVIALNGMKDFDLTGEMVRQVIETLQARKIDASILEELRPRFRSAASVVDTAFEFIKGDLEKELGKPRSKREILQDLAVQDEETFRAVRAVCERKLGTPIRAVGQESLHDLLSTIRHNYCGEDKPFAGMLILFDEFGRYMEFATQRPHIAGPGAIQQLYEAVQTNGDGVFLLGFIQYELRAYVSRVAPELRDELERYVSRYDSVPKVRLSTNLETLVANLLQKNGAAGQGGQWRANLDGSEEVLSRVQEWFPELKWHPVWSQREPFERIVCRGCWPLHPLSTLVLFRLASAGKSLHQRSALALLADTWDRVKRRPALPGSTVRPVDLCSEDLVEEFIATERFGHQGPSAQAFERVVEKFHGLLSDDELSILKAVLLLGKLRAKIDSKDGWLEAIQLLTGIPRTEVSKGLDSLAMDRGAISWNEASRQYEITIHGASRSEFLAFLQDKLSDIPLDSRAELFTSSFREWFPQYRQQVDTDFGIQNRISTREWQYEVAFGIVRSLPAHIRNAVASWKNATGVDQPKGQLIYCYLHPASDPVRVAEEARHELKQQVEMLGVSWESEGAPIAICLLHDKDGSLARGLAEFRVLSDQLAPEETGRFSVFIPDHLDTLKQSVHSRFEQLIGERRWVFATAQTIDEERLDRALIQLFSVAYPRRIPFPFDGLHSSTGKAADICGELTRALMQGAFSKEWISTRSVTERNRASTVLVECWQLLGDDGLLRLRPGNGEVLAVFDMIESRLSEERTLNLGKLFSMLCMPPYGCSNASAGLLLSAFIGSRREQLTLLVDGRTTAPESWLQDALPRRFLDPSVLGRTALVRVAASDEWRLLLEQWGQEKLYSNLVRRSAEARELESRIPLPAMYHHWRERLEERAREAQIRLNDWERRLDDALKKAESGMVQDNFVLISQGAANLARLENSMANEQGCWTEEQMEEVRQHRIKQQGMVRVNFTRWIGQVQPAPATQEREWFRRMESVVDNLELLELKQEAAELRKRIEEVRQYLGVIRETHEIAQEIQNLAKFTIIDDSTTMASLHRALESAGELQNRLDRARRRHVDAVAALQEEMQSQLNQFKLRCEQQKQRHRERLERVYDSEITSLDSMNRLMVEVSALEKIFDGEEQDIDDIKALSEELSILRDDYQRLSVETLTDEEFEQLADRCARSLEEHFGGEPPLFSDPYSGIKATIMDWRRRIASEWMRQNVPDISAIAKMDAQQAMDLLKRLRSAPRLLSSAQRLMVDQVMGACNQRLDRLEVEGIVARLRSLNEETLRQLFMAARDTNLIAPLCTNLECRAAVNGAGPHTFSRCSCPLFRDPAADGDAERSVLF